MDAIALKHLEIASALSLNSYSEIPHSTSGFVDRIYGGKYNEVVADIYVLQNATWVVFRGTDDVRDVLYDLDFCELDLRPELSGVRVHRGFWEMFRCIQNAVFNAVGHPDELHVTGHSMGGALALIAAPFLASPGTSAYCYGIAAPRVGNAEFCKFHRSKVKRTLVLMNKNDPVPHHPFWSYRPGLLLWMTRDGRMDAYANDFHTWRKICNVLFCVNTDDHKISNYLENIKREISKQQQSSS